MIETSEELAKRLEAASKAAGLKASTYCERHFGNSRLVKRLTAGGAISTKTYAKIISVIGPPKTEAA